MSGLNKSPNTEHESLVKLHHSINNGDNISVQNKPNDDFIHFDEKFDINSHYSSDDAFSNSLQNNEKKHAFPINMISLRIANNF